MDSKKVNEQFELLYKSKIERNIAPLEEERKKVQKLHNIVFSIVFVLFVLMMAFSIVASNNDTGDWGGYVIVALLGAILIFVAFILPIENKYRKKVKNKLLMQLFSVFGRFYYANKEAISLQEINNNGLFLRARQKYDDDVIVKI